VYDIPATHTRTHPQPPLSSPWPVLSPSLPSYRVAAAVLTAPQAVMLVVLLVLLLWGHLPTLGAGVRGVEEEQYQCILMGGGGEVEGPKASSRKSCIPHTGLSRFQCCTGRGGGGAFLAWRLLCVVVSCCLLRPSIQLRKRAGGEDVTSKQIELLFHEERGTQAHAPRSCDVLIGPQSKHHAWDKWMAFLRGPIYLNYGVVSAAQVKEGSGWGGFCPCCDVSFRHAPKPARATAVGSEMGICLRGLRAYYKQQRWQRSCIFFGTPTPQYRPTLSQNNSGPPIRGRPCSNIQLGHRITAHGHGPQWSTKGLGPYALPQEIKMHGIGEDDDTPRLDIRAEGEKMDQVGEFCYLGTVISTDGRCSAAIDDRTRKAWV